jgi:hypothetical protein
MAFTLAEMAKRTTNPLEKGVIKLYGESSDILAGLPFTTIPGNTITKNRELTPSGVGTRTVNAEYDNSTSGQEKITQQLIMMGGKALIDRYIVKTSGPDSNPVAEEIAAKVKAASMLFNKLFIKGDAVADANAFNGLEKRITGDQVISCGDSAGGDTLSFDKLDELIDTVGNPSFLVMNAWTRRKLNWLMRAAGQAFEYVKNDFGKLIPYYADIPIAVVGVDHEWNEIMDFDENDSNGDEAACTSIYAVRYGSDGVEGIQHSAPIVDDQGFVGNNRQIIVDWFVNYLINTPKSAARLQGIKKE